MIRFGKHAFSATLLLVLLALLPVAAPAAARELTYGCACVGTAGQPDCGARGIAGRHGQLVWDVPAGQVAPFYTPAPVGGGGSGWSCLAEGSYACICTGAAGRPGCGNGAVTGTKGEVRPRLSYRDVLKNYAPGGIEAERSGWTCVLTDVWLP